MPKNIKGGNKTKSQKNSSGPTKNRDVPKPEENDDSHVAIITKVQGDGRFLCQIVDVTGIQSQIYPVNLSKGVKNRYCRGIIVGTGTYILMSIRDFQKDKGDIIFIYRDSEIQYLVDNDIIIIKSNINDDEQEIQFSDTIEKNKENIDDIEINLNEV
jgi:hypothetical protein